MAAMNTEELHAALFGTWTAVARIAELLIRRAAIPEDDLSSLLTAAEMTATDRQSRVGMAIVRSIMESAIQHDSRIRTAPSSGELTNLLVQNHAGTRDRFGTDRHPAQAADCAGTRHGEREAVDYAMVKGSDFDDATLPGSRPETVAKRADRRDVGEPRSGSALGRSSPRRVTDRFVEPKDASLLDAVV